jgi:hypothetical protein
MACVSQFLGSEFKLCRKLVAEDFSIFTSARHIEDRLHNQQAICPALLDVYQTAPPPLAAILQGLPLEVLRGGCAA